MGHALVTRAEERGLVTKYMVHLGLGPLAQQPMHNIQRAGGPRHSEHGALGPVH